MLHKKALHNTNRLRNENNKISFEKMGLLRKNRRQLCYIKRAKVLQGHFGIFPGFGVLQSLQRKRV